MINEESCMFLNERIKNGSLTLLVLFSVMLFGAELAHAAARISRVSGISEGETLSGEVYIQTHVVDAEDGQEYQVRYQVDEEGIWARK